MYLAGISIGEGYFQTWAFVSRLRVFGRWLPRLIQWACGKITGHQASKTESGYGGGEWVDQWCRWCNKIGKVKKSEFLKQRPEFRSLVWEMTGCDIAQTDTLEAKP